MHWWAGYEGSGERAGKGQVVDSALSIFLEPFPASFRAAFEFRQGDDLHEDSLRGREVSHHTDAFQDTPVIVRRNLLYGVNRSFGQFHDIVPDLSLIHI